MSLLDALGVGGAAFPANSRYAGVATLTRAAPDGTETPYLARRFVPGPELHAATAVHRVTGYDRADTIAAAALGHPLLAWRLADANLVLHPGELVRDVGRALAIPLPQGLAAPAAQTEAFE